VACFFIPTNRHPVQQALQAQAHPRFLFTSECLSFHLSPGIDKTIEGVVHRHRRWTLASRKWTMGSSFVLIVSINNGTQSKEYRNSGYNPHRSSGARGSRRLYRSPEYRHRQDKTCSDKILLRREEEDSMALHFVKLPHTLAIKGRPVPTTRTKSLVCR
jgi:hypothetical protein